MPFDATLTNAVPPGEIVTEGSFGPWHRDDPGHTPVGGSFTFERADLGVFKGISGILASTGTYSGEIDTIHASGDADVPERRVREDGTQERARRRAGDGGAEGQRNLLRAGWRF